MGLLLSVLIACVGVVELITFYQDVKRNITSPPLCGNLDLISERYRKELQGVQHRLDEELQSVSGLPTFRINSHEKVEIEYNEDILKSRSPSPRTYLITEKERPDNDRESPRRFIVSDEPDTIKRSKSQTSLPEFLIQEQKNSPQPRYVLREHQDASSHPIPLPRQFIVTENELNTVVFDETCRPNDKDRCRRSPSPYPSLDLPHVPRNSICSDILENPTFSVVEYDEEDDTSSSVSGKVDMILESTNFNTTQYWTNKILVAPSRKHKSRPHSPGVQRREIKRNLTTVERTRSKSECDNKNVVQSLNNNNNNNKAVSNLELHREVDEDIEFNEDYLNSLDGVNKAKLKSINTKRSINRKKNASNSSIEKTTYPIPENVNENTSKTLTEAAEELKKVSQNDNKNTNKGPEPFWVKD